MKTLRSVCFALVAALALARGVVRADPVDAGATAPNDGGVLAASDALHWNLTSIDGGALELDGGVPTDADLRVFMEPRLGDFRVRLVDGTSRQIPARENVRLTEHTEVVIHPDPELQPGSTYRLVVEPDVSDAIRDAQGHPYAPAELRFRTAGSTPPRKSHATGKRNRHRR